MSPSPAATPERAPATTAHAHDLEASVQQDMMRLEVFREQLTALVREQELLRVSLESHARAQRTLEALETFQKDREILVPIGAEAYVQAQPRSTEKVLLGIGRGIVVELDRPKALEMVVQRRGQLEKSDQGLAAQLRRVETEATQLQARLQLMYQEMQQGAPGEGPSSAGAEAPVAGNRPRPRPS